MYKSNFLYDFWELNVAMYLTNNALTPDPELEPGILTSTPYDWPFLQKGIRMSSWDDSAVKFYMLGNPIVWWSSGFSVLFLLTLIGIHHLIKKRNPLYLNPLKQLRLSNAAQVCIGGWLLHYLPFYLMGRVTYLHHYFPSLLFAIMSFGLLMDHLSFTWNNKIKWLMSIVMIGTVTAVFVFFAPICYGIEGPSREFQSRHWLKSWNLINY